MAPARGIYKAAAFMGMLTSSTALSTNTTINASYGFSNGTPIATIDQGVIHGFRDAHSNAVYLGIPFAASTGGENRWRPPQDLPKSSRPFNATSYGATCPQAPGQVAFTELSEDCLNLNIWAPPSGDNLPVFVYMYGGAMVTGSNANTQLQGTNFARNGVVYVNFNTRESIFASPHSAELERENPDESQNFSILDVDKALEWIQANIAAFGGNPAHIVFGGHSSGSVQVDHYLWNHPNTTLAGAVQMSANALSGPAFAPRSEALNAVAAEHACPLDGAGAIACLRALPVSTLLTSTFNTSLNTLFTPAIDNKTRHADYATRFAAGSYASHVPLLTGSSAGEGAIFALVYAAENANFSSWIRSFDADVAHIPPRTLLAAYPATNASTTDAQRAGKQYGDARFTCAVTYLLRMRAAAQKTWAYRFFGAYDNVVGVPGTAPTHGTEVPFFHGGNECFSGLENVTAAQQALADEVFGWFVEWVKEPGRGPGWEAVQGEDGVVVGLGREGEDEERVEGRMGEFDAVCREVYEPAFPDYPVVQSIEGLLEGLGL